jgi:hypothetical protein
MQRMSDQDVQDRVQDEESCLWMWGPPAAGAMDATGGSSGTPSAEGCRPPGHGKGRGPVFFSNNIPFKAADDQYCRTLLAMTGPGMSYAPSTPFCSHTVPCLTGRRPVTGATLATELLDQEYAFQRGIVKTKLAGQMTTMSIDAWTGTPHQCL